LSDRERYPAQLHDVRALARPSVRQALNLSVSVAGTLGGALLLTSNIAIVLIGHVGTIPWLPLGANAALLFGGLMFAREYRRSR